MGRIQELSPELINQIAAGEVIESAHSVLKEMMENSVDAGADTIEVETRDGGLTSLLLSDNGSGIEEEDIPLALQRHATSKIRTLRDLELVSSYGFRGEALASIASVAKLALETGTGKETAWKVYAEKGQIQSKEAIPGFRGTKILVEDLFYNTPVRRKFLKSVRSEDKKIRDRVTVQALAREDIRFRFVQDHKEIYRLSPKDKRERIIDLFGENFRDHLLEVQLEKRGWKAKGYISDPDFYKSNRTGQFIFINGRPVEIKYSSHLLKKCYDELIPPNAHPYCFLFFEIDPEAIDVNVHPAKKEIRFLDEEGFNTFFLQLIQKELRSSTPVSFLELKNRLLRPEPKRMESTLHAFSSSASPNSDQQQLLGGSLYEEVRHSPSFSVEQVGPGARLHELTDLPIKHSEFIPKKHFGLLFETFILAEGEDGFYIIDQHTAHERIRYEEVLRKLKKKNYGIQPLLTPLRIPVSKQEAEEIKERIHEYEEVGLKLDSLGDDTMVLREVPGYFLPGHEKEIVLDFLNRIGGKEVPEPELYDLMAKCVACRSAVKKGDQLSDHLIAELLNRLSYCENPARCPHGRPTLVKLTREDLERMFHRR